MNLIARAHMYFEIARLIETRNDDKGESIAMRFICVRCYIIYVLD